MDCPLLSTGLDQGRFISNLQLSKATMQPAGRPTPALDSIVLRGQSSFVPLGIGSLSRGSFASRPRIYGNAAASPAACIRPTTPLQIFKSWRSRSQFYSTFGNRPAIVAKSVSYSCLLLFPLARLKRNMEPFASGSSAPQPLNVPFNDRWELLRPSIEHLYLHENKTLSEVMQVMKHQHGFHAE